MYYGSVNVQYLIEPLPAPEYYEESTLTAGLSTEEIAELDLTSIVAELEFTLTEAVTSNTLDLGAEILEADVGGGVDLLAEPVIEITATAPLDISNSGFSASDAIASFSLLMAPTVMVLARENELVSLLGDLYSSRSEEPEPPKKVEQPEEEEEEVDEHESDEGIFMRNIDHIFNFTKAWTQ